MSLHIGLQGRSIHRPWGHGAQLWKNLHVTINVPIHNDGSFQIHLDETLLVLVSTRIFINDNKSAPNAWISTELNQIIGPWVFKDTVFMILKMHGFNVLFQQINRLWRECATVELKPASVKIVTLKTNNIKCIRICKSNYHTIGSTDATSERYMLIIYCRMSALS